MTIIFHLYQQMVQHNAYKYFVCQFPGGPWTELPDVTLSQVSISFGSITVVNWFFGVLHCSRIHWFGA